MPSAEAGPRRHPLRGGSTGRAVAAGPAAISAAIPDGVSCSPRSRRNRAGRSAAGTASSQRRGAPRLRVDEDVRPPERVLDELERFACDGPGAGPADRLQPGEPTSSGAAVRVAQQGGVDPGSLSGAARRQRDGPLGDLGLGPGTGPRSADRPARQLQRAGRAPSAGGTTNSWPSSARPSLTRHSGVLIRRMLASSRRRRSTSTASFQACSRWWPGYVSWAAMWISSAARTGRSVFTSNRERRPPSYQL